MLNRSPLRERFTWLSAVLLFLAVNGLAVPKVVAAPSADLQKRALIVAVARYAPGSGWRPLHSGNDVEILRKVLEQQKFDAIHELRDEAATRQGIENAFRRHLIDPARPGDVVVFHYSGHGQQLTDDGGDAELDGYDEAIVPYDAPLDPPEGYRGEKHLRDDRLNELITELRRRVGPDGNVIAFIDSCFSGTPRGNAPARGGPAIGKPRPGAAPDARDEGSGAVEQPSPERGSGRNGGGLARYVVFSASRHDQLAYETLGDGGKWVGSLSYALGRELSTPGRQVARYRQLFEGIAWLMAKRVSNEPQVEGDIDAEIFNGKAVHQERFLEVASVRSETRITVSPGALAGLLPGSWAEIHAEGTPVPSDDTRLATGTVVLASLLESSFELDRSVEVGKLERARVFPKSYSFGDLRVRVAFEGLDPGVRARIQPTLEGVAALEIVENGTDVIVRQVRPGEGEPFLLVQTADAAQTILGPLSPGEEDLGDRIGNRLLDFARNRYLRGLRLQDEKFDVALEVVPVKVENCLTEYPSPDTCTVTPLDPGSKTTAGNQQHWRPGDFFKLRVRNSSARDAYLTILQLAPNGTIQQLWPEPGTKDKSTLPEGATRELQALVELEQRDVPGIEVLLLIATQQFVDFTPFETADTLASRGEPEGPLGPLAPLFDDESVKSRTKVHYPKTAVNTSAVTLTVVHGQEELRP